MHADPAPERILLGVVILGAGASSRMGRQKLLLPWGKTSVIGHLLTQWREVGAEQIGLVCAGSNQELERELIKVKFPPENRIINPQPERRMFSSIRCAGGWSGWSRPLTHWAISLGDQPHLRAETLRRLLNFAAHHPHKICQPSRNGRARHPVILPVADFKLLAEAPEDHLKQFLDARRDRLARCEIDDPGLELDLDTPEDYERALKLIAHDR